MLAAVRVFWISSHAYQDGEWNLDRLDRRLTLGLADALRAGNEPSGDIERLLAAFSKRQPPGTGVPAGTTPYCGSIWPRRRFSFSIMPLRNSLFSSPITLIEIFCGQTRWHSPKFVQPPKPSSSICRTIALARW